MGRIVILSIGMVANFLAMPRSGRVFKQSAYRGKRAAMYRARSQMLQCLQMLWAGITLVRSQSIPRIELVKLSHFPVTAHFGKNRCGTDGSHPSVTLNHGLGTAGQFRAAIAVHQHMMRQWPNGKYGTLHRQQGCLENIQFIDLCDLCPANGIGQGILPDLHCQLFTFFFTKFFRVGQVCNGMLRIQDYRSRDYGTRQRPTPHLINTGYPDGTTGQLQTALIHSPALSVPSAFHLPAADHTLPCPIQACDHYTLSAGINFMSTIKTAVIGVGYLGRFHAQKYAALADSELVAVVDANAETAARVAEECRTCALSDYRELAGQVQAVSIVVPTQQHFEVARFFLEQGIHVLLEKPMTVTVAEADELIILAAKKNCILQVGHLERFNSAVLALDGVLKEPRFIESHRLAPFNPRGADVNVVLDLMIHDIDIIQSLVRSPIRHIDADGVSVLTGEVDIANARIKFDNGCVANVTASRVSMKPQRKMRIFQPDAYISVDFQDKILSVHRKGDKEMFPGIPEIKSEESIFENSDAIREEIMAFLAAIRTGTPPPVSGKDGRDALATAIRISELLTQNA